MSDQKHTEEPWAEPITCDYYATKGPDILTAAALTHARKCVLALKGLKPEAVPKMVKALEFYSEADSILIQSKGVLINDDGYIAQAALAAAKEGE